ncbi:MAG TPA: oligopeptide/dipeptide ABC transporter ATP-binding protein, partial [Burkholderiaceae bacterium]|nr:oligopeptide/dipeptide ABC transporter ATP-binding protein [Burkholderiaceae bacterium]
AKQVVTQPAHPYTIALLNAVPRNVAGKHLPKAPPGAAPRGSADLQGCVFAPRCPLADSDCRAQSIALLETDEQHLVRCLRSANETIALKEG